MCAYTRICAYALYVLNASVWYHNKLLFEMGHTCISIYIESNMTMEMKRAIAIQIMVIGLTT